MKKTWFLVVLAAALLSLNAKCSDCDKAKAEALAVCQAQGADSQACKDAQAKVVTACAQPTPPPTTCPEQCPAGQVCVDPALGCQPEVAPGPVCTAGQYCDCWHNPGQGWQKAVCPAGQVCSANQCVTAPPTTCEPPCAADEKCVEHGTTDHTYTCEKIPGPTPPPLIPDEELTGVPDSGGIQMWAETDAAIKRYQKFHPEKWVEKSGGTCLVAGVPGIDEAFLSIATELARQSIVAGQSITKGGKRSDALFVNRTGTDLYEEMHLFDYARACVATGQNAYNGLYKRTPPPVTDACPYEPCPLKVFPDTGKPHWVFNAKPHTMGNCDSTPVEIKNCTFCTEIGMGDGGTRCSCPVRPDGHPERPAVEAWLTDGPVRDSRNGQDCRPNNTTNPMAFLCGTGNCRNCNGDKTVCTAWF